MARRAKFRAADRHLELAAAELPPDDPSIGAVDQRRNALHDALQEVDADIAGRMGRIEDLAAACRQHLADQAAIARARQAAANADAILGASDEGMARAAPDPSAEIAERT